VTPSREQRTDEQDWANFQALDRLTDHWWWRPGWRPTRRYLTWYLVFDADSPAVTLAQQLQAELDLPYLDPVPCDGFHLTVQGVGFADEVGDEQVRALGDQAEVLCRGLPPIRMTVGPLAGYSGGVFLRVSPWEPLEELRRRLRIAVSATLGEDAVPHERRTFKPHVSVAYCNAYVPAQTLIERVRRLREREPVTDTVKSADLLRVRRDGHVYRWDIERFISFNA
jgi:2'-5' RNA ligase